MKRLAAATILSVALTLTPKPVEAHSLRCAAYVGNPCYQHAVVHAWFHQILSLGFLR